MAMTLSSVVVVLVSGVFLVQNQFYSDQLTWAEVQDNARGLTELMAGELRSVGKGGVVVAESDEIVVRSPMTLAMVCARGADHDFVHVDGGFAVLDTTEVRGFAVRDSVGGWSYYNATAADIFGNKGDAAKECEKNGADTTGASNDFLRLEHLKSYHGSTPEVGEVLMLFRERQFKIQTSTLDPTTLGLYRGMYGDTLVEYATGVDTTAGFQYRLNGSTSYSSSVSGSSLEDIDAIRIDALARKPRRTGGKDDITFGWSVSVPLRNAR